MPRFNVNKFSLLLAKNRVFSVIGKFSTIFGSEANNLSFAIQSIKKNMCLSCMSFLETSRAKTAENLQIEGVIVKNILIDSIYHVLTCPKGVNDLFAVGN